jgi:CheY-like chemotaxis protein
LDTTWRDLLLVEDNPADVKLLQMAVRQSGHWPCRLYSMHDGEAALAFLRQDGAYVGAPRPQLVILDIGLPIRVAGKCWRPFGNARVGHTTDRQAYRRYKAKGPRAESRAAPVSMFQEAYGDRGVSRFGGRIGKADDGDYQPRVKSKKCSTFYLQQKYRVIQCREFFTPSHRVFNPPQSSHMMA